MKKVVLAALIVLMGVSSVFAQTQKEISKERKIISKMTKSELNAKASKDAMKEAKRLKKEGWTVAPGHLPLEKQLDRSYLMQMEYDEQLFPKYIVGDAMSIGENYDAAKHQALQLAILNLAANIQQEVTALVQNDVDNKQLQAEEAASVVETISASKNLISQSIGRTIPVVECYRDKANKNKEVRVIVFYNSKMAKESVKKAIRSDLEKKSGALVKSIDKILGL